MLPPKPSARGRSSSRGQAARRGAGTGSGTAAGGKNATAIWQGRAFYVQMERCCGVSDQVVSVRLDEDKYVRQSDVLRRGIEKYFDGQLRVETLDVPTLYALEVRVMPEEAHPRHGRRFIAQEAEAYGGKTIFSKIASKKWPQLDHVIQQLQEFCRVPVQIALWGREVKAHTGDSSVPRTPREVQQAVNADTRDGVARRSNTVGQQTVLPHATLYCMHPGEEARELHTNANGEAEVVLYPGNFTLICGEGSNYDRLSPNQIAVPARFALLQVAVTASMKKQCTFYVVDHLNRPFPRFPLKLTAKDTDAQPKPLHLQTKVNGRGKGRLGRGIYVAAYDAKDRVPQEVWPVAPLTQELEVQDTEVPQFFQICVHRLRFTCEILFRTRFEEPVSRCPFVVKSPERGDRIVARGTSSDIGVAMCDLPNGRFVLKLEPGEDSPFVVAQFDIQVSDDGSFTPHERTVETKTVDVLINLVTPDGEPAPRCQFHLAPQFAEGSSGRPWEMSFVTDDEGRASATMSLLEPYVFRVKDTGKAAEYMPQEFVFLTDRWSITAVVARSIFGPIMEDRVVVAIDVSGSMQSYLQDIKASLNLALVQQFHKSNRQFNIVAFTGRQTNFRPGLVDCAPENIEDAMRFCETIEAGGVSNILEAIAHVLRTPGLQAMYLVTDGKCELGDGFLNQVKALYFACPARPRINTIGINCVPQRLTYRGLRALSILTQSSFRAVCLEQDMTDPVGQILGPGAPGGLDLASGMATTTDEEVGLEMDDDAEF